jgi:high-affinity nickel-transport protein
VVFIASLLLAIGVRGVADVMQDEQSQTGNTLAVIGSLVAGAFLLFIGIANLAAVNGILKVLRAMRDGEYDEEELERHLHNRGLIARLLDRVTRRVSRPWQLYPVGLLMGLGFDTATQVALLVLAAGSAAFALPWYAILTMPVLFAAGMSLFDTIDGVVMTRAYGWAFLTPVRKVFYNLTVTVLSVSVALGIGSLVLVGLLVEQFDFSEGPLAWLAGLNLDYVGFAMVVIFLLAWATALVAWRKFGIEAKWEQQVRSAVPGPMVKEK